jgi:hypothetical protein
MTAKGLRTCRAALAGGAALLLPFLAAADSQLARGAAHTTLEASAHLDFKIVIPRVLSMDIADGLTDMRGAIDARGARTVAIYANSHNATLAATLPSSDRARGNVILNSAAWKVISQNALCTPGLAHAAIARPARGLAGQPSNAPVTCTASMP